MHAKALVASCLLSFPFASAMAAVVDVTTLGSTVSGAGGAQVDCCGFNPAFSQTLSYNSVAAVLTVGVAGQLAGIDVQLAGTSAASLTMLILPVLAGTPSTNLASALASFTVSSPAWSSVGVYPLTSVDTSSSNLFFNVGDRFAVALVSNSPNVVTGWASFGPSPVVSTFDRTSSTGPWDSSIFGLLPGQDVALRTRMNPVPLPAAAWLMLGALGGLGAVCRGRKVMPNRGESPGESTPIS